MPCLIVFSDLDGSLLDAQTYSYEAAHEALHALRIQNIPLIPVSSKTRAEIEPLCFRLDLHHPFITENGGGIFIPKGYFDFPLEGAVLRGSHQVIELGTPYAQLRAALKEIVQTVGHPLRGFGDMPAEEIAERTGLSLADAVLAKQRDYDEPFLIDGPAELVKEVARQAESRGLRCVIGGRFHHLIGHSDKGKACRILIDCYRRKSGRHTGALVTIGVGDSANDLPLLAAVDRPILVQKPDGSYDPTVTRPDLVKAPGIGPSGWNRAILDCLGLAV